MKLLREFCEIVDEFPNIAAGLLVIAVVSMLVAVCVYSESRHHEYKMELLKQGKVSIESIK